jgi:hemolysin III
MSGFVPSRMEREEFANAITHGFGVLLTLVGTPILLNLGLEGGDWYQVLGLSIYCFSLLMVYSTSTVYHSIKNPWYKRVFRKIDHISIYFLIAGTHTPFLIKYLNNGLGMFYLYILWALVLIGIIYKAFFIHRLKFLSLIFYLGLGWMAVLTIPPMLDQMNDSCFYWIMIGGAFYTLGIIFYVWKKIPYHHSIWHLFVIAGSTGHFIAMLYAFG